MLCTSNNRFFAFIAISFFAACLSLQTAAAGIPMQPDNSSEGWITYPLSGGEMTSIASDPVDPQVLYVGTRDAGVFKTSDGAVTWKPARTGLTFYPIRSLQIDPQNSQVIYAGTDFDGLWKSTDGGANWNKASAGLDESLIVFQIVIDPIEPETIYVGLAGGFAYSIGNIYKSLDGGTTWEKQGVGFPIHSDNYTNGIFALAVDSDNPATLYAGTNYDGAFRSTDGGSTWSAINDCLPFMSGSDVWRQSVNALALNPHDDHRPSAIIGGYYYVLDNTECWQQVSADYLGGIARNHLYFHTFDPLTIYVAGGWGISRSNDGGVNWEQLHSGNEIAFHPTFPDTLFAATDVSYADAGGVFRSTDQGITWAKMSDGITGIAVRSVAIDPQDPAYLYVGTGGGHLFRSRDGGLTWDQSYRDSDNPSSPPDNPNFRGSIDDIAVGPSSQHVYVAAGEVFRSTNQGEGFDSIAEMVLSPKTIAIVHGVPETIYVGTIGQGIYKSSDGGDTWVPKNNGLPFDSNIVSLAIDPNEPQKVWAGTWFWSEGIFQSIDGGESWVSKGLTGHNAINAIAVKPGNSNEILVGKEELNTAAIYKSTDGGGTWQVKASDIAPPYKIVYDPQNPNWVYAATEGMGVIHSLDGGETWQDYSAGIFFPLVYDLDVSRNDPPLLVAATYGSGVIHRQPTVNKPAFLGALFLLLL